MSIEISPKSFFQQPSVADMRLIACPGAEELTGLIDKHLVRWAKDAGIDKETFIISCDCPRFQSGDAKGLVKESVRGDDIFIVVDPGNYSVTYKLFDNVNHMSPDDHFANLKRLIQAVAGKAHRVSVIMPSLYGGRQHRRVVRESLDCAVALQELQTMGVQNIITFDAHDPRVQNAVPLMSFDNAMPTYQVLKSLLKKDPEISFDKNKFTVVSPDEGAPAAALGPGILPVKLPHQSNQPPGSGGALGQIPQNLGGIIGKIGQFLFQALFTGVPCRLDPLGKLPVAALFGKYQTAIVHRAIAYNGIPGIQLGQSLQLVQGLPQVLGRLFHALTALGGLDALADNLDLLSQIFPEIRHQIVPPDRLGRILQFLDTAVLHTFLQPAVRIQVAQGAVEYL